MKHKKGFAAVLLTLIISALLSVSAFAASDGFSDVPEASPFYESVTDLAGQGIAYGTGNGRYAPDTPITVRQWATMICRAFDKEDALSDPAGYGGDACINQGYADGWLNLPAMAVRTPACAAMPSMKAALLPLTLPFTVLSSTRRGKPCLRRAMLSALL